jgi:hypothetical protein
MRNNEKGTCMLIHLATVRVCNVIKKEAENFLEYKYLDTEIQRIWTAKTKLIPVNNMGNWNHL